MGQDASCNSACNSDANKAAAPVEQAPQPFMSPMPGTFAAGQELPGQAAALPMPLDQASNQLVPAGNIPCNAGDCGTIDPMPMRVYDDVQTYPMGYQPAVEFLQPVVCEGPNCPQANYKEVQPGVLQSLTDPNDIIYLEEAMPQPEIRSSRISAAKGVYVSEAAKQRLSQGSRGRRSGSRQERLSQGSRAQHGIGNNNLIVAAAMEAPVEAPVEKEEEAPAQAPAPKKQKKKRRFTWKRKKASNRGADEVEDFE